MSRRSIPETFPDYLSRSRLASAPPRQATTIVRPASRLSSPRFSNMMPPRGRHPRRAIVSEINIHEDETADPTILQRLQALEQQIVEQRILNPEFWTELRALSDVVGRTLPSLQSTIGVLSAEVMRLSEVVQRLSDRADVQEAQRVRGTEQQQGMGPTDDEVDWEDADDDDEDDDDDQWEDAPEGTIPFEQPGYTAEDVENHSPEVEQEELVEDESGVEEQGDEVRFTGFFHAMNVRLGLGML